MYMKSSVQKTKQEFHLKQPRNYNWKNSNPSPPPTSSIISEANPSALKHLRKQLRKGESGFVNYSRLFTISSNARKTKYPTLLFPETVFWLLNIRLLCRNVDGGFRL